MIKKFLLNILCINICMIWLDTRTESKTIFNMPSYKNTRYYHLTRPTRFSLSHITPDETSDYFHKFFEDLYSIGSELISLDTMKLLTYIAPFYIIARRADKPIHKKFYNYSTQTNKNQPPSWVNKLLFDAIPIIPAVMYGLTAFVHEDYYARRTAQIFCAGFLWAWSSKILLKQLKSASCLRPLNANYNSKLVHGGNPSGHTSIAAFSATFLGLTRGPKWGIPLSLAAATTGTLGFINNRHYLSQVVAGAGLGVIIGFAAHQVLEKIPEPSHLTMSFGLSQEGKPGLTLAYNF